MIAFPLMLVPAAEEAGMKVPENIEDFDPVEFPHFQVFLNAQLGRRMPSATSHWNNAKIIAAIPNDKIMTITSIELENLIQ